MKNEKWTKDGYTQHGSLTLYMFENEGEMMGFVDIPDMPIRICMGAFISWCDEWQYVSNEIIQTFQLSENNEWSYISGVSLFGYPVTVKPECEKWVEMYERMTDGLVNIDLE